MAIEDILQNKDAKQKADIKAREIVKLNNIQKTKIGDYYIEIISINKYLTPLGNAGVEVLVKSWDKNDKQLGFGKDGTVEIERFRIINPPILIPDDNGNIERQIEMPDGNFIVKKYREDLTEALLQSLEHTIKVKKQIFDDKKIIKNKIGSTTLTAYPAAGANAPVDGRIERVSSIDEDWATLLAGTGDTPSATNSSMLARIQTSATTDQYQKLSYALAGFDTSSIGSDNVDSGTVSTWGIGKRNQLGSSIGLTLIEASPAAENTIANGDMQNFGTTRFATDVAYASYDGTDSSYTDQTLNASGEAHIDKGGNTFFGWKLDFVFDNNEPTWASVQEDYFFFYTADQTGTSNDPKLVVEHSEAAVTGFMTTNTGHWGT